MKKRSFKKIMSALMALTMAASLQCAPVNAASNGYALYENFDSAPKV